MKAAILTGQNKPLEVDQVTIPSLEAGQVLVKVEYSGICGKQLEEITGKRGDDHYIPHLLGHEGSGIVSEVGPGVRKVKAGDRVVLHWIKGSGIDSAPPRFQRGTSTISAGWVTTFSEYTVVSENRVTPFTAEIGFAAAALMGCAVTTGLGIVFNNAALMPGQSIAVFGVGGVGINVIQGAALVNAYPVVAIDLFDHKLEQAKIFGATHTLNASHSDVAKVLSNITDGKGFDAVVDVTGNSGVRQTAYNATSNTGITIFAGVPHHEETITVDSFPLHFGRRVVGSHGGETKPDVDIPKYIQLYQLGKLKLDEQITHRFPLAEVNDAVALMQKGDVGRCVISMSD